MQGFKSPGSAPRFLASHAAVYNNFYTQRHLTSRFTMRTLRGQAEHAWTTATTSASAAGKGLKIISLPLN